MNGSPARGNLKKATKKIDFTKLNEAQSIVLLQLMRTTTMDSKLTSEEYTMNNNRVIVNQDSSN